MPDDYELCSDGYPYPYLINNRNEAVKSLLKLTHLIKELLPESNVHVYEEWIDIIQAQEYENVIVRTEELSWFYKEGEMKENLSQVLNSIRKNAKAPSSKFPKAFYDLAGLWEFEGWYCIFDTQLVGERNSKTP